MRNFGRRILTRLPLPPRVLELYERFEEGVFGAVGLRHLPMLAFLTGLIWMTEGLRLYIVVQALGFPDVQLGLSGAVFVALIGSLLTAIPLSPAGLGFAQAGVIGVLTVAYGVPLPEATAITILDWVISVLSIIVFGAVAYVVSPMPRGQGRIKRHRRAPARVQPPDARRRARRAAAWSHRTHWGMRPKVTPTRPPRTAPHRTAIASRGAREASRYQRVIQASRAPHRIVGVIAATIRPLRSIRSAQTHDDPERPSVQRMASSPAQGQEDVAAAACPAVGGGPFHDLAVDPRRSHAVPRDRDQARPRPPRASRRCRHAAVPRPGRGRHTNPTARVEYALRADELLSEPQVRQIMEYYLAVRMRRYGRSFQPSENNGADRAPERPGRTSASSSPIGVGAGATVSTVRPVSRSVGRDPGRY